MKNLLLFICLMAAAQLTTAQKVNVESSSVEWVGKKITGQHTGTIQLQSGELAMTDGMLTGGSFVIDMTSIAVTDLTGGGAEKLKGHLMSDDFFGTEAHPTATLTITDVTKAGLRDELMVKGDLTIKGITKPISFPVLMNGDKATADILVDRTNYDIKYGSGSFFDNLGDKAIDNDFSLKVNLDISTL